MKLLYCTFTTSCTASVFVLDWATASNDMPTPLHNSMYAPIECLLNCFVNKCSFSGNEVHKYSSPTSGIRRTCPGSTMIPSLISTEGISNCHSAKLKLPLLRWSDKACRHLCRHSVRCRFPNLGATTSMYASCWSVEHILRVEWKLGSWISLL